MWLRLLLVCALSANASAAAPGLGVRRISVARVSHGARALRGVAALYRPPSPAQPDDGDAGAEVLAELPTIKVGLLVEPTPFTHVSGYANRFNEMLRFLRRSGNTDVSIITPDDTDEAPSEAHGYPVTTVSGFRFPLYPLCLSIDPDCGAARMVEEFRPALLHASSPSFLMAVALALSWLYRLPLMLSYHTHLPIYGREYLRTVNWFGWLERAAWAFIRFYHNHADLTLTTSPQLADELRAHGVRNVEVWPKGVDTIKFDPKYKSAQMRARLGGLDPATGEERPLLVYVGRVCESKRLQQLRHTLDRIPHASLAVVGGGPSLPRFEAEFADLVVAGRVVFTGMMKGAELSAAFASGDVFVMPSDSETLGFVVLESMVSARRAARHPPRRASELTLRATPLLARPQASGVPPVGVRAGGVPDLIEHGKTGLLAAPGDEGMDDFTEQVRRLVDDKQLRAAMGAAARAEAERWSWEAATAMLRTQKYTRAVSRHEKKLLAAGIDSGQVRPRTWPRFIVWLLTLAIIARVSATRGRVRASPPQRLSSRTLASRARRRRRCRPAPGCSSRGSCCTCPSRWRAPRSNACAPCARLSGAWPRRRRAHPRRVPNETSCWLVLSARRPS